MQLSQLITKVVPFTRKNFNDKIIEGDSENEEGVAYLFLNMAYRSEKNIETLKCFKCIYDLQNSLIFIFCDKGYSEFFIEHMV